VKFISSAANSGNTMTYYMQLGVDPKAKPTPDAKTSDYAELSIAPWFGLPMCDPKSYPQNPCTPDSDTNSATSRTRTRPAPRSWSSSSGHPAEPGAVGRARGRRLHAAGPTTRRRSGHASVASKCEYSDAVCAPRGSRTTNLDSGPQEWSWPVAGCADNFFQNGDVDFDGNDYRPDWPDGAGNHPQPFRYAGPSDAGGNPYPSIQFETNVAASEKNSDFDTGAGCKALPDGAAFYPFWTIGNQSSPFTDGKGKPEKACLWNFGNTIKGVTTNDFGTTAEYGTPNLARFAGTLTSRVMANPQLNSSC
jgi:hypothetical protein